MIKPINIAFCINKNHLIYALITSLSLAINNKNTRLDVYIVNNGDINEADLHQYLKVFSTNNLHNVKIYLVDISTHIQYKNISFTNRNWGEQVYYKILFPSLFVNLDKILYLDSDVICKSEISKIYNMIEENQENILFVADKVRRGFNCGVLLINLKLAKKLNIQDTLLKYLLAYRTIYENKYSNSEEYLFNKYYKQYMQYMGENNIVSFASKLHIKLTKKLWNNISLIHYIGKKPWHMSISRRYASRGLRVWYLYAKFFISPQSNFKFNLVAFFNIYIAKYLYSLLFFKKFKKSFKNSLEKRLKSTFI